MSARPRLVQEGTPVTSSNEYGGYNDGYYEDDRQYYRGRGRYGGGRDYGYGGRGYGRGYGGRLHYRGYGGGRDYGYGGRGRYSSYYGGGFRGRGYGGRGRYYGGGRGRYHHGSSLQGRTNNFPPGPKTSISTRLVIGGGGEGAEEQQQTNGYDNYENLAYEHAQYADYSREAHMAKAKSSNIQTRLVIGEANDGEEQHHAGSMDIEEIIPSTYNEELHQIERMEGVESLEAKEPLIVMDGPNIAYAYADAMAGLEKSGDGKRQPDNRGLLVAANYFLEVGIRVLIVLPAPWFRAKPRPGDEDKGKSLAATLLGLDRVVFVFSLTRLLARQPDNGHGADGGFAGIEGARFVGGGSTAGRRRCVRVDDWSSRGEPGPGKERGWRLRSFERHVSGRHGEGPELVAVAQGRTRPHLICLL